jgi:hypothetical protein
MTYRTLPLRLPDVASEATWGNLWATIAARLWLGWGLREISPRALMLRLGAVYRIEARSGLRVAAFQRVLLQTRCGPHNLAQHLREAFDFWRRVDSPKGPADESTLGNRKRYPLVCALLSVAAGDPKPKRLSPEQDAVPEVFRDDSLDTLSTREYL